MIIAIALAIVATTPEPPIAPLLQRIRLSVPDAREVRDLQVCPPRRVSRDGRKYDTWVALARPREARAYYLAEWRDGKVAKLVPYPLSLSAAEGDFLAGLALRGMERTFENCRWVSADELAAAWADIDH